MFGDTIVEVLISMAILSVVITGAYLTASSSLISERTAQEHAVALTIAQSQVEDIASLYAQNATIVENSYPCFYLNKTTNTIAGQNNPTNCYVASNNVAAGPESQQSNAPYSYKIKIIESPKSVSSGGGVSSSVIIDTYTITVTWPPLTGNGNNQVQLYYQPN